VRLLLVLALIAAAFALTTWIEQMW
jgi:hypothetical protein